MQQEALHVAGLFVQNFVGQVVHDVVMAAGEGRDKFGSIGTSLERQCRQVQPDDPTFCALRQRGDVIHCQV